MNIKDIKVKTHGNLKEKVLQIGEGNFLRAFADWMINCSNSLGVFNGSIVICKPRANGTVDAINEQNCIYTLIMRGIENNETIVREEVITSVSRCINPYEDYNSLLEISRSTELKVIISNTTEAGIVYHEGDKPNDAPPLSFPAKMTVILHERYKAFNGDQKKGLLILPVELIARNGDNLRNIVMRYAKEWGYENGFISWLNYSNCFANTLVDRIVTGYPKDEIKELSRILGYEDNIMVTSEPYHLWVIEASKKWSEVFPLDKTGLNVVWTDDITPYHTRKVRILNGAHTVSALAAFMAGYDTVFEMIKDKIFDKYLRTCIWNEIIPLVPLPDNEMNDFANSVFERFSNPFVKHNLLDISMNSVSKYRTRCLPSLLEYINLNKKPPMILTFGLAALIAFYRGSLHDGKMAGKRGKYNYEIRDVEDVLQFFQDSWSKPQDIVKRTLSNKAFWGLDLTGIEGLEALVGEYLNAILDSGVKEALEALLGGV